MFINEYGDREDTTVILLAPMMVSGLNLYELIYVNEIERFIESGDIEDMKKTAAFRAADRNPYSWNMEFIPLASKKRLRCWLALHLVYRRTEGRVSL